MVQELRVQATLSIKTLGIMAEEMVQELRVLATLSEDLGLIPTTYMV